MICENNKSLEVLSIQAPSSVVMVRPHHFLPNPETEQDNAFQHRADEGANVAKRAYDEVTQVVNVLRARGVNVHLFEDNGHHTPDSVFPNNWFSTHADGQLGLYPMYCENRRAERRSDIIDYLQRHYSISGITDYSRFERQGVFLEGTGALVLDHQYKIAYAARSHRMDESLLASFCRQFGYQSVVFDSTDEEGIPIYHTNVMMCVGTAFVMVGLDTIKNESQKSQLIASINASGKVLVELTQQQIRQFAGNALELSTPNGPILALSQSAYSALSEAQRLQLSQWVDLVPFAIPTIELAGGSVRCMLAGVHFSNI